MTTALAREFLQAYPTPAAVAGLTERQWQRWARAHRLSEARTQELWAVLQRPQLPVPAHVVRAKARLLQTLLTELEPVVAAVGAYRQAVEDFFAGMPAAPWMRTLPLGEHGITAPPHRARLGDAPGRWETFQHLQAQAGSVPVTVKSGKQHVVHFRFACDRVVGTEAPAVVPIDRGRRGCVHHHRRGIDRGPIGGIRIHGRERAAYHGGISAREVASRRCRSLGGFR